jgi:hypothetical protein
MQNGHRPSMMKDEVKEHEHDETYKKQFALIQSTPLLLSAVCCLLCH